MSKTGRSVKAYSRYLFIMAGLGGLLYGVDIGIIAAALPYINFSANYTEAQLGLIVGMVLWGSVISSFIAGQLSEWFGRKAIIILAAGCFSISIPIICSSGLFEGGNFALLLVGRILQGAAGGLIGVVVPMYLAECLDAKHRGRGTAAFQLILTLGLVSAALIGLIVTYCVGPATAQAVDEATRQSWTMAWQIIFWCSMIPGVILFFGAFGLKESPRWLYKKGHKDEALQSLAANNGEERAAEILEQIANSISTMEDRKRLQKAEQKKETLLQRKYVLPFLLTIAILVLIQGTGMNSVLSYSVVIFRETGLEGEFANWSDLVIKLINFAATFIGLALVDKLGRKFLLKTGALGILIGQLGIAFVFLGINTGFLQASMTTGVIATICLLIFVAAFALGPGVCVWLALTELMPTRIRANGMAIGMVLNQATSALIASIFPMLTSSIGYSNVFFILAISSACLFLVALFLLPETKGKTLEEIGKYFEKKEKG